MCIRDSNSHAFLEQVGLTGNDGTYKLDVVGRYGDDRRDVVAVIAVVAAIPVSYTHLDVYKRQIQSSRFFG